MSVATGRSGAARGAGRAMPQGMRLSPSAVRAFRRSVYRHYARHGRKFPWRSAPDPYRVLVSEIMLQQTHADRVAEKFPAFIISFPDFASLALAPLRRVLAAWRGLGYNRRALALKRIAARVVAECGGALPRSPEELRALPGIGKATASSIAAFAFGAPAVFVETNIRAAFIHGFFPGRRTVDDREILPLVQQTLDARDPQRWYNALMDYGAMIKARHGNPARRSAHHRGQPAFAGSDRQLRGRALRALLAGGTADAGALAARLGEDAVRMERILAGLRRDGLVERRRGGFSIA